MAKQKEVKTNAMRLLDRLHIEYTHHTYECGEFKDGVHIADLAGLPYERVFKTLVTVSGQAHFVFVLPVHKELDLKKAARAANVKSLSMLPLKEVTAVTGYVRGGCTALGMKKKFPTFLDASAENADMIIVSGGKIGSQISLSPDAFLKATDGIFADITMA